MDQRKWHKGSPPHVGWWNASNSKGKHHWKWWDGKHWSTLILEHYNAIEIAYLFYYFPHRPMDKTEWTAYYPKNARVPRIDPRKGAV